MGMEKSVSVKKLFVVAITLKITSTVLGWALGSPWILGFVVPIAIMVLYIVVGLYRRDKSELSEEKFADSCYYLGFIFTISSIIVSLFDLPIIGDRLGDVAVRFGAAMTSTVLGLVVRVYLVNFKKDVHDINESVEDDLLDAANTLRTYLEMATEKMHEFNGIVDEASKTAMSRVHMSLEETAAYYSKRFSGLFSQIASSNKKAAEDSVAHLQRVSDQLDSTVTGYVESLNSSMDRFEGKLTEFAANLHQRLSGITFPEDYFAQSLTEPMAQLKLSVGSISGEVEEVVRGMRNGSGRVTRALEKVSTSAEGVSESIGQVKTVVVGQNEALALAKDQVEALGRLVATVQALETAVENVTTDIAAQHERFGRFAEVVERASTGREALVQYAERQSTATEEVSRQVGRLNEVVSGVADGIAQASSLKGEVAVYSEKLEKVLGTVMKAVEKSISETAHQPREERPTRGIFRGFKTSLSGRDSGTFSSRGEAPRPADGTGVNMTDPR